VDLATGTRSSIIRATPFIGVDHEVVTTAVAKTLGPRTVLDALYRHGELAPDGILDGDLYVKGFGDPTLTIERLWRLVHDVSVEGVVEVKGNVVFDDDFFGDDYLVPGWTKKVDIANGPTYFAPLGALSLNFNTACIVVAPGPAAGGPARVVLDTPASVLVIDKVAPWAGLCSRRARGRREGAHCLHVAGRCRSTRGAPFLPSIGPPTTMAVFADLLKEQGSRSAAVPRRRRQTTTNRIVARAFGSRVDSS
jgi:hypothetical protein